MATPLVRLEREKRKRTALRASTTRLLKKIEREMQETDVDRLIIEESLEQLTAKEASLNVIDKEIEDLIEDLDALDSEIESREEYKDRIVSGKTRANRLLGNADSANREERTVQRRPSCNGVGVGTTAQIRLPRLSIEKFNGEACGWLSFWAQYVSAIHENISLSEVDKFNYLNSYLEESAAKAIAGLPLISENYERALDILKKRFGRKDIIVNAHMNRLLNLSPVKGTNDVKALRRLYDDCEVQIRSLETMGMASDAYGELLCPLLFKLIPQDLALEFNRQRDETEELKIDKLLAFIRREVESLESTHLLTSKESNEERAVRSYNKIEGPKFKQGQQTQRLASATALNIATEEPCIFCEDSRHKTDDCKNHTISEKIDLLRNRGRCFICLKRRHLARDCRANVVCPTCKKRHKKTLCRQEYPERETQNSAVVASLIPNIDSSDERKTVLLQTVRAVTGDTNIKTEVRCLLDGGSQRTFIREDLSRGLRLPIVGKEVLKVHTFGRSTAESVTRNRVKIKLKKIGGGETIEIEALETPEICAAFMQYPSEKLMGRIQDLGLQLSDTPTEEGQRGALTLLIGSDYYWQIVTGKMKRLTHSLMMTETIFGWTINGPAGSNQICGREDIGTMKVVISNGEVEDDQTSIQLRKFWELESLGITEHQEGRAVSDDEALQTFKSTVAFKNGRYEVRLPWKLEGLLPASGYGIAKRRLESLVRRFRNNLLLYDDYKEIINDYLKQGIVEQVKEHGKESDTKQPLFYLSHQAVVRREKATTKVRIVFDASAHEPGTPSLNALLHPGPNMNPDLFNLLLKFRKHGVVFVADIEKAFLQISIAEEDRDALRFLWLEELPNRPDEPIKIKVLRMTRVMFGVTSSPFLLAAVIKHHLVGQKEEHAHACTVLNESLYVDDLMDGANNVEEAFQVSSEIKQIMQAANMPLRKWRTNSKELQEMWDKANFETSSGSAKINETDTSAKVLGLMWDTRKDVFKFDMSSLLEFLIHHKQTKRNVLQASGRIFDPIGFLSPFTIRVKILFQELWKREIMWDEDLPDDVKQDWSMWCEELPRLSELTVPRCFITEDPNSAPGNIELHCFVDASEKAYGAVVFLRYSTNDGRIGVTFVASKTRVAPLKTLSVPRLELMSAMLGSRLVAHLKTVWERDQNVKYHYWSDSIIALCWIRDAADTRKPFVGNSVKEICALTDLEHWKYCPGNDNPADFLTRGERLSDLVKSKKWWNGPRWLKETESHWPAVPYSQLCQTVPWEEIESEKRKGKILVGLVTEVKFKKPIIDLRRFSSLLKIIRTTAWVMRFLHNAKNKGDRRNGPLATEELKSAEKYLIVNVQKQAFEEEINSLRSNLDLQKSSTIKNCNPFLDDEGLLRVGGRLRYSELPYDEKYPLLISDKGEYASLLIKDCHERVAHGGVAATLVQLKNRFWIL